MVYPNATKNIPKIIINTNESLTGFFELNWHQIDFCLQFYADWKTKNSGIQNEATASVNHFFTYGFSLDIRV